MGKPKDGLADPSPLPTPVGESASSISLRESIVNPPVQRYFDDDPAELHDEDLPPLYTDEDEALAPQVGNPLLLPSVMAPQIRPFFRNAAADDTEYYIDKALDHDPAFLEEQLRILACVPPRPMVHIRGVHHETVRNGDRSERKEMVDFDVQIELTALLYEDISRGLAWNRLCTVGPFDKVRRGTVLPTRAPGFGGSGGAAEDGGMPDLREWCHRYCASHSGLKALTLERRVTGWDFENLGTRLETLVRATNYRGRLSVTFPVRGSRVQIYNDCRTNRWRLTKWIEMLFVFTLLFLLSWPYLLLRTKRWDVVYAEWELSRWDEVAGRPRYASMSEDRWFNLWGRAIHNAVLARRQGMLDQGDLERADAVQQPAEGIVGWVQAGVQAMGVVDRSFGWGGDR
ncbi:hypothetical protein B0I35DRAFT_431454 [Stachybotrys elegans]|uniref:Uncharacterized protein n=1 Tax=Stachybotrys elegans TaxID=80388 RepID=A0A8K0SUA8_9HYPO|nr:hypothetical protein B0I35DRAFT_431454 [Stachybotrys elegans]